MRSINKKFIPAALMILMSIIIPSAVNANDGSMGRTPDGVFPMLENDVIMESEDITVDLEKNSVECIFVFRNTGGDKDVLMGFPGKLEDNYEGLTDPANLEIKNFKTFVKGKQLKVTHEKNSENVNQEPSNTLHYSEWFTFNVHFDADEKLTVRNTYQFVPSHDSMGNVYTGYIIKTGTLWKGAIGSTKVTFKLGKIKPYQVNSLKLGGFKYEGDALVWERKDFEPEYDLSLMYNNWKYSKEYLSYDYADSEELAGIHKKVEDFTNVKSLSGSGKTGELLQLYNRAVNENNYLLALYAGSFLPDEELSGLKPELGDIKVEKTDSSYLISNDIKFEEIAIINMSVSHMENGKEVMDLNEHYSGYYFDFAPGIEYDIRYTLEDWLGNTQKKEIKFMMPDEQPAGLSYVAAEQAAVPSMSLGQKPSNETQEGIHDNILFSIAIAVAGIVILGLLAVTITIKFKNIKKFKG